MKLSKGKQNAAVKAVIYGSEGIGKSTLASHCPNPLFIDIENGTKQLDVTRVDEKIDSWKKLMEILDEIEKDPGICRSLVIDTVDAAEILCTKMVLEKYKKGGIEDFGFSKGYTYLAEEMELFLEKLSYLNETFGINIVLLAHSMMRKFEEPDKSGAYDRWELKLQRRTAPLVKAWCDVLLFCNYKTFIVSESQGMSKSNKIHGGERVIYTTHHPAWDAKNRFGLAEELPLEYNAIKDIFLLDAPDPKLHKDLSKNDLQKIDDEVPFSVNEPEPIFDEDFTEINNIGIPLDLARLMERDEISEEEIINACIQTNMIPEFNELENRRTRISDLGLDFIQNNLINRWDGFIKFVKGK